jgi:LPS export ABC transporter protein LptC
MRRAAALLVLALGCKQQQAVPLTQGAFLPDSADQMAFGARFVLTDAGVRRAIVRADTLLTYQENTRTELRNVHTTFFTLAGEENAVLTSKRGSYDVRLGVMEARGDVVVVSSDGRRLETQQLRYDPTRNEVSSDSAFVLTEGERMTQGVGFVADPELNNVRILRVIRAGGQPVTIPKR